MMAGLCAECSAPALGACPLCGRLLCARCRDRHACGGRRL